MSNYSGNFDRMSWFKAFRNEYDYTSYGDNRSAATVDIPFVAVIYLSILVSVATLIATIGIRGKERWSTFVRVAYSLFVGASILVCIYGHGWQSGSLHTDSFYTFVSKEKVHGSVGVKMGLSSVNITLSGQFGPRHSPVDYNERLKWFDVGQVQADYQGCMVRGLPEPILSVAAYMSFDDGGLRWGRWFRDAGYFAYCLLWTSFAFWLVTNILLSSVVFYGSAMFTLSGATMCLSVIVYHVLQPKYSMKIPFEDGVLTLKYDWCFWLTLISGIVTTVLGFILLLLDWVAPNKLAMFFLMDRVYDDEEDDTNHNLLQSPNGNNVAPTKRSYLSLITNGFTNSQGKLTGVDRQTSTLNPEIHKVNMFRSVDNVRLTGPNGSHPVRFHSQGFLNRNHFATGSLSTLIRNNSNESTHSIPISNALNQSTASIHMSSGHSSIHGSLESLSFESSSYDVKDVAIDIQTDICPETHAVVVETDTHL